MYENQQLKLQFELLSFHSVSLNFIHFDPISRRQFGKSLGRFGQ